MRLMELRAHPLMTCSGLPNWPPVWMWTDGNVNKDPKGEVGTLVEVQVSQSQRANRFFLVIEYEDSQYMGCLQFDDPSFRRRVCDLLGKYCGHSIEEIGSLDLSISIAGLEISMTALKALAILEAAVLECKKRNINTLEVRDALNFLEPHTQPPWLILQYRNALDRDWTTDVGRDGQQQVLRATFPGIRSSVKELLGKQIDALAGRFAVSQDTRVGEEIERMAKEYGKLGEPWVFVAR